MPKPKNIHRGMPAIWFDQKPVDIPLSESMARAYDFWPNPDDRQNEFFTNFKYSRLSGIGKDPGVSRRDPSKVLKIEGTYYVWYTRRATIDDPVGMDNCDERRPAVDWDLADVYYATSEDGFAWTEQGMAVGRSARGSYGDRSVTTPDVLLYDGGYYLFYRTFTGPFSRAKGDYCDVSMAWADSPSGPWTRAGDPIIELGMPDAWDGGAIHDPCPLIYQGKIWLFYKGHPLNRNLNKIVRAQGVACADVPGGPYTKSVLNPVLSSGHETCLFPYREGLAAILSIDGPEKNTIQYAPDGLRFEMKSIISCPPIAPGPYCPDAFADNGDGKGISWGLCHLSDNQLAPPGDARRMMESNSFLARFDCDLHRDMDRPYFKNSEDQVGRFGEETYFQEKMLLEESMRQTIIQTQQDQDHNTI